MKTMKLTGIRQLEMFEVPKPEIKNNDDVLIKLKTVGVCGSDVHYYTTGRIGSQVVKFPYPVGHECAGIVAEVGNAVTELKAGDRVAIDPAVSCGQCDQCLAGREHTCRKLLFLGCPGQLDGCLSEYIVMPRQCCYKIKDAMTFQQAAISEPLAIGVYAVKKSIPIKGATIGIFGAGPIGLSVLMPAKAQGAKKIFVTDKIDARLDLAAKCGADWCGNVNKFDPSEKITSIEPMLLDVVFECCGQQEAIDAAIDTLKPGGKLVLIGIPEIGRISFQIDLMRRKEICVQNIRRQVGCVQDALDMIDDKLFDVDVMATHHFKFEQTKQAFDLVAGYKDGVVKAMIEFD